MYSANIDNNDDNSAESLLSSLDKAQLEEHFHTSLGSAPICWVFWHRAGNMMKSEGVFPPDSEAGLSWQLD